MSNEDVGIKSPAAPSPGIDQNAQSIAQQPKKRSIFTRIGQRLTGSRNERQIINVSRNAIPHSSVESVIIQDKQPKPATTHKWSQTTTRQANATTSNGIFKRILKILTGQRPSAKAGIDAEIASAMAKRKPVAPRSESGRIAEGAQAMGLKRIQTQTAMTIERLEKGKQLELGTLGGSVNPVARLRSDGFIPKSKFPQEDYQLTLSTKANAISQIKFTLRSALMTVPADIKQEVIKVIEASYGDPPLAAIKNLPETANPQQVSKACTESLNTARKNLTDALALIKEEIGSKKKEGASTKELEAKYKSVSDCLHKLTLLEELVREKPLTELYSKSSLIASLRIDLSTLGSDESDIPDTLKATDNSIRSLIRAVQATPGEYVSKKEIHQSLIKDLEGQRAFEIKELKKKGASQEKIIAKLKSEKASQKDIREAKGKIGEIESEIREVKQKMDRQIMEAKDQDPFKSIEQFIKQAKIRKLENQHLSTIEALKQKGASEDEIQATHMQKTKEITEMQDPDYLIERATHLEPHYSIQEAIGNSPNQKELPNQLQALVSSQGSPEYAFKAQQGIVGSENFSEMKNQDLNRLFGLTSHLVNKGAAQLSGATIVAGQTKYQNPSGIHSTFLEGKGMNSKIISNLAGKKAAIAAKRAKGEEISPAEMEELDKAREAAKAEIGAQSAIEHAMMDLELFSGDSHYNQYLVTDDGSGPQATAIEFSRSNPPGEAMFLPVEGSSEPETQCLLVSFFLDHPHCEDTPIPDHMVDKFLSRNLEEEEAKLRDHGMIGDLAFFDMAARRMQGMEDDARRLNSTTDHKVIFDIADKYGVEVRERDMRRGQKYVDLQKNKILASMIQERSQIKKACLSVDHPRGHALRQERVQKMQEYLREAAASHARPTVKGMQEYVLKDTIGPFLNLWERMNGNPAMNISMDRVAGQPLKLLTLEEILRRGIAAGLVTPEEQTNLEEALARVRERAYTRAERQTVAD